MSMLKLIISIILISSAAAKCPNYRNPCKRLSLLCGVEGICTPTNDCRNFTCTCPPNTFGANCMPNKESCATFYSPGFSCENNGVCHETEVEVYCRCPSGFKGRHCEVPDKTTSGGVGIAGYRISNDIYNDFDDSCQEKVGYLELSVFGGSTELIGKLSGLVKEFEDSYSMKFAVNVDQYGINFFEFQQKQARRISEFFGNYSKLYISENATELYVIFQVSCCNTTTCLSMDQLLEKIALYGMSFSAKSILAPPSDINSRGIGSFKNMIAGVGLTIFGVLGVLYGAFESTEIGMTKEEEEEMMTNERVQRGLYDNLEKVDKRTVEKFTEVLAKLRSGMALSEGEVSFLANGTSTDAFYRNAIHILAKDSTIPEETAFNYITALTQRGLNINAFEFYGLTPITYASQEGNINMVNKLLELGVDPMARESEKVSCALSAAIFGRHKELAQRLFECPEVQRAIREYRLKKEFKLCAIDGDSTLFGLIEFIKFYLESGTKWECPLPFVDYMDTNMDSPLHFAAANGQSKSVHLLMRIEEMINLKDYDGNTALHLAVQNKKFDVVQILLEHNASTSIRNAKKEDVFDLAKKMGVLEDYQTVYNTVFGRNAVEQVKEVSQPKTMKRKAPEVLTPTRENVVQNLGNDEKFQQNYMMYNQQQNLQPQQHVQQPQLLQQQNQQLLHQFQHQMQLQQPTQQPIFYLPGNQQHYQQQNQHQQLPLFPPQQHYDHMEPHYGSHPVLPQYHAHNQQINYYPQKQLQNYGNLPNQQGNHYGSLNQQMHYPQQQYQPHYGSQQIYPQNNYDYQFSHSQF